MLTPGFPGELRRISREEITADCGWNNNYALQACTRLPNGVPLHFVYVYTFFL